MKEKRICLDCANNLGYQFRQEAGGGQAYIGLCNFCQKIKVIASLLNWIVPQ